MARVLLDSSINRSVVGEFAFPLGVYPVEPTTPTPGFVQQFEAADGAEPFLSGPESEEWEEWPDRFMFDVLVPAPRLASLVRTFIPLLPTRVYPILDILGNDDYREIDPYIAYDLVGLDRFIDGIRDFGPWLFEDGLVGFGAMSMDPFIYFFLDEHKILTIRVQLDLKDTVERLLAAYDLSAIDEIHGADAVSHEHRTVLLPPPDDRPEILSAPEIVERLRADWALQLNVQGDVNVDDEGNELGVTGWQCIVRCLPDERGPEAYAEVLLTAASLDAAEQMAIDAIAAQPPSEEGWLEVEPLSSDRATPERFGELLGSDPASALAEPRVCEVRWPAGAQE
jgi:hypothetical protein